MRKNKYILRFQHMPGTVHKMLSPASFAKLKNAEKSVYKFVPKTIAAFLFSTAVSGANLPGSSIPQINLLAEFRPIGGSGNNLQNRNFDPVPGSPEIALAPLNFAPKTRNGLVDGPNPDDQQCHCRRHWSERSERGNGRSGCFSVALRFWPVRRS